MSSALRKETPGLLPGWRQVRLGDVCSKPQYGWTTKAATERGSIKLLRTTDITPGRIDWSSVPYCTEPPPDLAKYLVHEGDILISRAGSVGVSHLVTKAELSVFASYLIRFKPGPEILPKYLAHFLRSPSYWRQIADNTAGIAVPNVNASKLQEVMLPLAPLDAQAEIIAEIEKQFSRLDEAAANLKRVKANLKRYKAAVLKAAVEGRLVPTEAELARREGRSYETGAQLLQRILETRRSEWKGKGQYKEAADARAGNCYQLPKGWSWASLGQLTTSVKDGPHYSPKYVPQGIPFISGGNVRPEGIDFTTAKFITQELHAELAMRCKPEFGDILYTKGGTTGIARVNTERREFNVWVHVAVLKPVGTIHRFYLQHALNLPHCYKQAQAYTHGVGNQDLGLTRMVWITVPLPPLSEQARIAQQVDRQLSIAAVIERQVSNDLQRTDGLRQSIVSGAFANQQRTGHSISSR